MSPLILTWADADTQTDVHTDTHAHKGVTDIQTDAHTDKVADEGEAEKLLLEIQSLTDKVCYNNTDLSFLNQ